MVSGASLSQHIRVLMILSTYLELNPSLIIQVQIRVGTYFYFQPSVYTLFRSSQLFHILLKLWKWLALARNPRILSRTKLILGSKSNLMNSIDIFGVFYFKGKSLGTKIWFFVFSLWKLGMFSHNFLLIVFNSFMWTSGFIANWHLQKQVFEKRCF